LTPSTSFLFTDISSNRFLSPDGRSYAFDDRANGYGRGEGVGSIIIKPLADAMRDGDPIRAVIRQTCLNQDGKTPGITMPSREAQEVLIRSAYQAVGLDPAQTPYVECHGTGTQAGDPLEAGAISSAMCSSAHRIDPVYIGSVKTNIGHLEAGSGIAGVIKAVMTGSENERSAITLTHSGSDHFAALAPGCSSACLCQQLWVWGHQWPCDSGTSRPVSLVRPECHRAIEW